MSTHKKTVIVTIACLLLAGWEISGYCQDEDESGSGAQERN